jgi:hypothetical protein
MVNKRRGGEGEKKKIKDKSKRIKVRKFAE